MPNETKTNQEIIDAKNSKVEKLISGIFFAFITSIGILSGFSYSLGATKKQDSKNYSKGIQPDLYNLHESGAKLARRALLRASVYSVTGFSIFCFSIWKLSGANTFEEFRYKAGAILPRISKPKSEQEGRTEFQNLTDLFQYIIDEDNKKKENNKK